LQILNERFARGEIPKDEYRADVLRRLEEDRCEFEHFLDRLRMAKDKAEFDQFIAERCPRPDSPEPQPKVCSQQGGSQDNSIGDATMHQRLSAFLVLCVIALMQPLQAIAQQQTQPPEWYWPGPWQFWWICPLMMLFMLAVIATIFFAARRSSADGSHHWGPPWRMMGSDPSHSALQILNERFARGEIQNEEYEQKKAAISSAGQR
jgi:uncharacterized membrane protein